VNKDKGQINLKLVGKFVGLSILSIGLTLLGFVLGFAILGLVEYGY
jgi:uncharacterized membrane protein